MSKPSFLAWWPVVVSIVTIVASASATIATVTNLQRAVDALETRMLAHERAPGHADSISRLRVLEAESVSRAAIDAELRAQLRRIDVNLAVVCQATPGAQCQR